jgi:predicted small lipoprotein YifL
VRRVAVAAVMLGALAGCGDEGPSKEEYIESADRVCAEYDRPLAAVNQAYVRATERGDIEAAIEGLDEGLRVGERQLRDLRELTPPEDDAQAIKEQLDQAARQLELVRGIRRALSDGDVERVERTGDELRSGDERYDRLARDYGYEVCGKR